MKKMMTDYFDCQDAFAAEMQPLIDKIHDFCTLHNIPYVFGACIKNSADKFAIQSACHFVGPGRTPPELVVSLALQTKGIKEGIMEANRMMLAQLIFGGQDDEEEGAASDAASSTEIEPASSTKH